MGYVVMSGGLTQREIPKYIEPEEEEGKSKKKKTSEDKKEDKKADKGKLLSNIKKRGPKKPA